MLWHSDGDLHGSGGGWGRKEGTYKVNCVVSGGLGLFI